MNEYIFDRDYKLYFKLEVAGSVVVWRIVKYIDEASQNWLFNARIYSLDQALEKTKTETYARHYPLLPSECFELIHGSGDRGAI